MNSLKLNCVFVNYQNVRFWQLLWRRCGRSGTRKNPAEEFPERRNDFEGHCLVSKLEINDSSAGQITFFRAPFRGAGGPRGQLSRVLFHFRSDRLRQGPVRLAYDAEEDGQDSKENKQEPGRGDDPFIGHFFSL